MGLLRWLLWPRRRREDDDDEPEKGSRSRRKDAHGVYRIEVDQEVGRFHRDGPAFSFWSSSRIILILSFLLWWIQPAGPMIAGYVGGRRAGSPWKAVVAALLPVFTILLANYAYAHNFAARQLDVVGSLPVAAGDGVAALLPFLAPYKDFLIAYIQGFVDALRATFGMGTNGYLMVILFAYIGGLIAEQTRRELAYRSGSGTSVGLNLVQPILHPRGYADEEDDEGEYEEAPRRHRRPSRARAAPVAGPKRRRSYRGSPDRFEEYRQVDAEALGSRGESRSTRRRRAEADKASEDDDEGDEEDAPMRARHPSRAHATGRHAHEHEVPAEREPRGESRERRPAKPRSHDEEVAIQRFVERALRNYDHSKL